MAGSDETEAGAEAIAAASVGDGVASTKTGASRKTGADTRTGAGRRWLWLALEWAVVLALLAPGLWLRVRRFETAGTQLDSAYPHLFGALIAWGERPPLVGAPAGLMLRHGALNYYLLAPLAWLLRSFLATSRAMSGIRGLTALGVYGVGRGLGAPVLALGFALGYALAPEGIEQARIGGGTYFLEPVLLLSLGAIGWAFRPGRVVAVPGRWGWRRWLQGRQRVGPLVLAGLLVGSLPYLHPMGAPLALALGGSLLWHARALGSDRGAGLGRRRLLGVVLGAGLLPSAPYLLAELITRGAALRSLWALATGSSPLNAVGEEGVGLGWTLTILLRQAGTLAGGVGVLVGAPLVVGWRWLRDAPQRALGLATWAAGATLLAGLMVLQGRTSYGFGHHVTPVYLCWALAFCAAVGALRTRFRRARWLGPALGLALGAAVVAQTAPRWRVLVHRTEQWESGANSLGSIEAMAGAIWQRTRGIPYHILMVHSPETSLKTPVLATATAQVVWGRHPDWMPWERPAVPPRGFAILVRRRNDPRPRGLPGRQLPFQDPNPDTFPEHFVEIWEVERFDTLLTWAKALPQDWGLWGPEEYLDFLDYYYHLPPWPGADGTVPLSDTPYRTGR